MTTLNDIKAAITMSIDPMEEILDDLVDEDMMNYWRPWSSSNTWRRLSTTSRMPVTRWRT